MRTVLLSLLLEKTDQLVQESSGGLTGEIKAEGRGEIPKIPLCGPTLGKVDLTSCNLIVELEGLGEGHVLVLHVIGGRELSGSI